MPGFSRAILLVVYKLLASTSIESSFSDSDSVSTAATQTPSTTGTPIPSPYACNTLASAAERAKYLAPYGIRSCACGPSCSDPARAKISEKRRESLRKPLTLFPPPEPTTPRDKWIQPAVKRVQELEEEGLQAPELYKRTLHLLVNAYTHLQDVDKALFYAKKLKSVYKAREGVDLPAMYLSKSGLKSSPGYMAAAMQKNFKLPPGAPPMLMTAFS
ncbi:hypothetical protein BT96DRAFT_992228 [Gymnopus androsaceus JB14]|uniref:Uncharacterized protein n=1 Tax=Gymnopus androsaceus JB14 TaxID=1447944 RepID=A0A6A4HWP6_9AGAR|nr:hypothetical protein BT96DRAFT_992228 [Gymnopus androsaceus JB14]